MTIFVSTRDPGLEESVCAALERAGWSCAPLSAGAPWQEIERAGAVIVDAESDTPLLSASSVPTILLLSDGASSCLAATPAHSARAVVRKPFTQRALENALHAVLPARARRAGPPLALEPAMREACAQLEALAATSLSVVLSGETGTGKTHLARYLHAISARAQGACVELASAALGELSLAQAGLLEQAHGGTLLVEDVAELPAADQLALLRLLVDRSGPGGEPIDARVIATSRAGLARETEAGRLHPDLAARLGAAEISLPPLRSRPLELEPFARAFAERAARALDVLPPVLDEAACAALRDLALPGNLHELENLMRRATLLAAGRPVDFAALRRLAGGAPPAQAPRPQLPAEVLDLRTLERRAIERALVFSRGDRTLAARALGIHVRTLRNKLRSDPR